MEEIRKELSDLEKRGTFDATLNDVQAMINMLEKAKANIAADPDTAPLTMMKLKQPMKSSWDQANGDLKKVYSALNTYGKALNKKFKQQDLSVVENDAISSERFLVNRAIAMHLLREGQFGVASTFIKEANAAQPYNASSAAMQGPPSNGAYSSSHTQSVNQAEQSQQDWEVKSEALQKEFTAMYHVLDELRLNRNLVPAIDWSRQHNRALENRGSNLEFELCRLQFIALFMGSTNPTDGALRAWAYARSEFTPFQQRYAAEIQQLIGALAFRDNIGESPYASIFENDAAWEEVAGSFTREFCSLLGLSAESPLHIAVNAGAIALPSLLKVRTVMKVAGSQWTTAQELPVEIPLPPKYHFHSIFVCPVSKEQATDQNPPMMMPCGHVICKESLERVSKGTRFKCNYCPGESHPRDAKKVFL